MSRGYTMHLCDVNKRADAGSPGVRLGTFCIQRNISVTVVAQALGVTRASVYNWFSGVSIPSEENIPLIEAFIKKYR